MDPKKALDPLQKLGVPLPSRAVLIAVVVLPLLIAAGVWLWKRWQKRKSTALAPAPVQASGAVAESPALAPRQLRRAWLRFIRALPRLYRRSILNFEHFVVLGDVGSGKSRLIDAYTDWRRQAKQFLGSQAFDPDLQVYLGSQTVVTELPAKVLLDHGAGCAKALRRLWRPLYRSRSPTVVVVLDIERLKTTPPELITDFAERMRGKINLLSGIRRRALEVRLVLTHLDASEGWDSFANFCKQEKIPLFIPLRCEAGQPPVERQLASWTERARDHLARALLQQDSTRFRQIIGFLRRAPEIPLPLARFVDVLLAPEALSLMPRAAGVYLGSAPAAWPNPLLGETDPAPPPDPRLRHWIAATVLACTVVPYMIVAFATQRGLYNAARAALEDYQPSLVGSIGELKRRDAITSFASRSRGPIETRPDFYRDARRDLRKLASERIRSNLLLPNLMRVAQDGALEERSLPLPWRRSLFYLALIHGDKQDGMRILDPERLRVWSRMTELPPGLIADYLAITDNAQRSPVEFDLSGHGLDVHDGIAFWTSFLQDIGRAGAGRTLDARTLHALQARAEDGANSLDRFEHDVLAASIIANLDDAASLGSSAREPVELEATYKPKFRELLSGVAASDVFGQRERAREVFRTIRITSIAQPQVDLVSELAERISALYATPLDPAAKQNVTLKVAGETYSFDAKRWAELVRNSQASELVAGFLRSELDRPSIFFEHDAEQDFQPLSWNGANDGSSIFVGTANIPGLFTRAAYTKLVEQPILRLSKALESTKLPDEQQKALDHFVSEQVQRYAREYKQKVREFYQSFALATPSQAALRVAVAQMVADPSPFSSFIKVVDSQVSVATGNTMLAPMSDALAEYAQFHKLVDASAGAAELEKYRAILAQLLLDLGPADDDSGHAPAPDSSAQDAPTLEQDLTREGRLALLNLRGEKGSYGSLVARWLASVQLPSSQRSPFLWPVYELDRLGRRDIEQVLARAWQREVVPGLSHLLHQFPFDPHSQQDAQPREIDALLNPKSGQLVSLFGRYLKDLSEPGQGPTPYRARQAVASLIAFPGDMYATLNAAAALASHLYDAQGTPAPLALRVATVPFDQGTDPRLVLTLVYFTVGEASIYNFNQRPGLSTIRFDWTREQVSQVGIQFTNLDTQENVFPDPIATASSHFSALRLLTAAQSSAVKRPAGGELHSWNIPHQRGGQRSTPARFIVVGNPLSWFALGRGEEPLASRARLP